MSVPDYLGNENWCKLMEGWFNDVDQDKKDFVTRKDWFVVIDKLEVLFPHRKDMITIARQCTNDHLDSLGLMEGMKADKQMFKELAADYVLKEQELFKSGKMTTLEKLMNAMFDILDTNNSGYLNFDEYKVLTTVYNNLDEKTIRAAFELLDTDKDGRLIKKEFAAAALFRISYVLDDSGLKNFMEASTTTPTAN